MKDGKSKYCPFCQRDIEPSNTEEVESGLHDGYIYVHDEVGHDPDYDFTDLN